MLICNCVYVPYINIISKHFRRYTLTYLLVHISFTYIRAHTHTQTCILSVRSSGGRRLS